MAVKQAHIHVSGRVQGVFFRANTDRQAKNLGLTGWVRNLIDGRVEVLAEGEEEMVGQLIEFCRESPGSSMVDDVDVEWKDACCDYTGFTVKY